MSKIHYYEDTQTIELWNEKAYYIHHWSDDDSFDQLSQKDIEENSLKITLSNGGLQLNGTEAYAVYCTKWDYEVRIPFPSLKRAIYKLEGSRS